MKVNSSRGVQPTELTEAKKAIQPTVAGEHEDLASGVQTKAYEARFVSNFLQAKVSRTPPPVGAGTASSGKGTATVYKIGDPTRPKMFFDNGHLQNPANDKDPKPMPTIPPTEADIQFYQKERVQVKVGAAAIAGGLNEDFKVPSQIPGSGKVNQKTKFLDSPNGIGAYDHFLNGNGVDREFSYEDYVANDAAGTITLKNVTKDLQKGVEDVYSQLLAKNPALKDKAITFKITGGAIQAGVEPKFTKDKKRIPSKFPYAYTDDWQKALGGHKVWTSATVTVKPSPTPGGKPQFSMRMTLHAEDRYNFNRKQSDIETGIPDSVRGRLEKVGLGRQYRNHATLERDVTWKRGEVNKPGATTSVPTR